ncbi:MAG: MBL fold metallo-hydrolase [Ruminococcus sp.]|nr:MBL fold metallo-hydrolase [Ruminococcus sp.]
MKRVLTLLLCILLILCTAGCFAEEKTAKITSESISKEDAGLVLHFIDVGQGDCTLIESKGRFALIDAGERTESNKVVSYLSSAGVESLDFIISTHPHSDHCGGLADVIRNFDTAVLICPDVYTESYVWENVLDAADERGVAYETPNPYEFYQLGDSTVTVLSPKPDAVYSNLNDYSVVCMVEYGNTSALLTGDAEKTVERELVRGSYDLSADILKCGHHGSSTSTCSEFLHAVSPSAAIISCGENNDYGHPHRETIEILQSSHIPSWRTDIHGDIVATSDGNNFYISTSTDETRVTTPKNDNTPAYIGNKNSKVLHRATCESVTKMKDSNKVSFDTWDEAKKKGYTPCGACNP